MIDVLMQALPIAFVAAVPLLLAVQGEVVAQRSGLINLGVEGMMLMAAMAATLGAQASASATVGVLSGVAGALCAASIFGFFSIQLRADQIVTGTALNLFALGVTGFLYREMQSSPLMTAPVPQLDGRVVAVAAWVLLPLGLAMFLWRTESGLQLRAAGENPEALDATKGSTRRSRWLALVIEGVFVGIAGADLSLALSSGFAENMTAGRGFIALSIVIFGRWKLRGAVAGCALFGIAGVLQYALQAANRGVQFHLLLAFPYVITLVILAVVGGRVRAPEALGRR